MSQSEIHSLSGAYAVDALDDIERAQFERHLAECPACREEVAGLREAAAELSHTTAVAPPAALRDRLLADIATVRPLPPETAPAPTTQSAASPRPAARTRIAWYQRPGLVAAAAVAAIALGATAVVTHPWSNDVGQTLSATERVLDAPDAQQLSAPVRSVSGASITVVRSASQHRAVMMTDGVPAPPPGKVYQAWYLEPSGQMVSVGLMSSVHDGRQVLLNGDAATAQAVAITLEPAGGSPSPTQQPLVQVSFGRA